MNSITNVIVSVKKEQNDKTTVADLKFNQWFRRKDNGTLYRKLTLPGSAELIVIGFDSGRVDGFYISNIKHDEIAIPIEVQAIISLTVTGGWDLET